MCEQDIPRKYGQPVFDNYVAIDIEHNGFPGHEEKNQILEVAAVAVSHGKVMNKFHTRIRLQVPFNPYVEKHSQLHEADYLDDILPDEGQALADFRFILSEFDIVSHNAKVDVENLNARLRLYGLDPLRNLYSDTWKIYHGFKGKDQNVKSKLGMIADELGLPRFKEHCAPEDALTHARIFEKIVHGRELSE